jgi:hypothetical protein
MRLILPFFCALVSSAQAIIIELRYDYDSQGFFNQAGSKEALRAVADFYERILSDSLTAIVSSESNTWTPIFNHPGTGADQTIPGLIVPADTIIIYVGGRNLPESTRGIAGPGGYNASGFTPWFDTLKGRGQAGALTSPPTDFSLWGGSASFDLDSTWNFSTTGRIANSSATDFVPIALHELGHVLGIGTADSWDAKINNSNHFTGAASVQAFGGTVPLQTGGSHWQDDGACSFPNGFMEGNTNGVLNKTYGSFGRAHGLQQIAIMDPVSCTITSNTFLQVLTDIDIAALIDIGWQVKLPLTMTSSFNGNPSFTWLSSSNYFYAIRRTTDLIQFTDLFTPASGNGDLKSFTDPSPPAGKAFYQLARTNTLPNQASFRTVVVPVAEENGQIQTISRPYRVVDGCCADACAPAVR